MAMFTVRKSVLLFGLILLATLGFNLPQLSLAEDEGPTYKAGVSYTTEKAQEEAFQDLNDQIDTDLYPSKDPNFKDHYDARLSNTTRLGDKVLTYFDNGSYAVYKIGGYEAYYYTYEGKLFKIGISSKPRGMKIYPNRDVEYRYTTGKMMSVGLYISRQESYVFYPSGELVAHWKMNQGFNAKGNVILTRTWVEPTDNTEPQSEWANNPYKY